MSKYIKREDLMKLLKSLPLNTELPQVIKAVENFKNSKVNSMFGKKVKDLTNAERYQYSKNLGTVHLKGYYKKEGRVENSLCWKLFEKHYRDLTRREQAKYRDYLRKSVDKVK